ncbi:hypothetical protein H4582DRAFT_1969417 [Lactarius indigo]|nr:hypothetical protein H4582DRAFT_1969417 [Lactarius indigo]
MQPINAHADRGDSPSRLAQHPCFPVRIPGSEPDPYAHIIHTYSADSSPSHPTTNSDSTRTSNSSFSYPARSINSVQESQELPSLGVLGLFSSVPPEVLIWQVRRLYTDLLQHTETGLVPAGRVLLQSEGLHDDLSQRVPIRINGVTRCCAELFIALAREVLLKDAVGVEGLEEPCEFLHLTFRNILFEPKDFDLMTSNLNEKGHPQAPRADAQGPEPVATLLRILLSVIDSFKIALDVIDSPALNDEALREYHRQVSLKFPPVTKDLTIDQYRKVLGKRLAQVHPLHPQKISTMEKVSETMDVSEWDFVDPSSQSCSNKRSFTRRFLYPLFSPLSRIKKKER